MHCLLPALTRTTVRQFSRIILALLALPGRVTMRGIARWTGAGGRYRTVQRFCATALPWASLFWLFFRAHLFRCTETSLLGGDETVVTKAGKQTHGLDRCFAGLYGRPVPGLACFALSLISIQQRRSFPLQIAQVVRAAEEKRRHAPSSARRPRPTPPAHASRAARRAAPRQRRRPCL